MRNEAQLVWQGMLANAGGTDWRVVIPHDRSPVIVERVGVDAAGDDRWEDVEPHTEVYAFALAAAMRYLLERIDTILATEHGHEEDNEEDHEEAGKALDK